MTMVHVNVNSWCDCSSVSYDASISQIQGHSLVIGFIPLRKFKGHIVHKAGCCSCSNFVMFYDNFSSCKLSTPVAFESKLHDSYGAMAYCIDGWFQSSNSAQELRKLPELGYFS